jgi:hypothetical protein
MRASIPEERFIDVEIIAEHDDGTRGLRRFSPPASVRRHIENLYCKIGAHSRADAIASALRHHLA